MKWYFAGLATLSALLIGLSVVAQERGEPAREKEQVAEQEKPDPADVQDIVYFSETQPVLLRLHVRIKNKPFRTDWNAFIDAVFKFVDTNGDGVIDEKEAIRIPPTAVLFAGSNGNFGVNRRGPPQAAPDFKSIDTDGNGKISKAELAAYYARSGAPAFQVRNGADPGPARGQRVLRLSPDGRVIGGDDGSMAERLNDAIFKILDTNKDGKLSPEELDAAPALLLKLDANDDEMITPDELFGEYVGDGGGFPGNVAFAVQGNLNGGTGKPDGSFYVLEPGDNGAELAKELLRRYGKGKGEEMATSLTRQQLGLDIQTFNKLDVNGDGVLDAKELAAFAKREADVEITVRMGLNDGNGPRPPQPLPRLPGQQVQKRVLDAEMAGPSGVAVTLHKGKALPPGVKVTETPQGAVMLEMGRTRIELGGPTGNGFDRNAGRLLVAPPPRQARLVDQYIAEFKRADTDGNGYLDEKEAMQSPLFRNTFKLMDLDGDGKLYEKEVRQYLAAMESLEASVANAGITLNVSDRGRGLFDLLDTDRDGRLSVREMRQIKQKFLALDRDGDGCLSRTEVPRDLRVSFSPTRNGDDFATQFVLVQQGGFTPDRGPRAEAKGPLWFRKMDRNGDGDVSRREWLGTEEEFRKIDTDGDGLISLEEAEAYDKLMRQGKKEGR
jgi:Ca2+-binding EF-hand superfamily protein